MSDKADTMPPASSPAPAGDKQDLCEWACRALREGRSAEALGQWRAAGAPAENDPAFAVAVALLEAEVGDWASVLRRCRAVLGVASDNPLAGGLAGLAAYYTGNLEEAVRQFRTHGLFAAFPLVRLFIWSFAEEVYRQPWKYPWPGSEEAGGREEKETTGSAAAETIPAREPDGTAPRPGLWKQVLRGGGVGAGARCRALLCEADSALRRNDLMEALACFRQASRENPSHWMSRMAVGFCLLESGRIEEGAEILFSLLGDHPELPPVVSATAWACHALGRTDDALDLLETLHPAGPDDWGMNYLGALCFYATGRTGEADVLLRQALGPYFLDTWEQYVQPLFHRVVFALERRSTAPADSSRPDVSSCARTANS
jgi:tetratricopeptide (TPR) repeat protein